MIKYSLSTQLSRWTHCKMSCNARKSVICSKCKAVCNLLPSQLRASAWDFKKRNQILYIKKSFFFFFITTQNPKHTVYFIGVLWVIENGSTRTQNAFRGSAEADWRSSLFLVHIDGQAASIVQLLL